MVNTRRGTENNSIGIQLKYAQLKLERNEKKLELVLNWIKRRFGEFHESFKPLHKLLRDFDEFNPLPSSKSAQVNITSKTITEKRSNVKPRASQTSTTAPPKKSKVAYVLVEPLTPQISQDVTSPQFHVQLPITINPKGVRFITNTPSIDPDHDSELITGESRFSILRRPRKTAHKIRCAQESGDEVIIPNAICEPICDEKIAANSDPLRLSNPPSPSSSTKSDNRSNLKFEPEDDEFGTSTESELGAISDYEPNVDTSMENEILQIVYNCAHCEKSFVKSKCFLKHQLLHNSVQDSEMRLETTLELGNSLVNRFNKLLRRKVRTEKSKPFKERKQRKLSTRKTPVKRKGKIGRPDTGRAGPFICEFCGAVLKSRPSYNSHISSQHSQSSYNGTPKESFTCTVCGKILGSKSSFRNHCRLHTGIKAFLCCICGRSFARRHTLDVHLAVHSEERTFKCTYCDQSFRQKQGLRVHINRHLRRAEKHCPICGQTHSSMSNLKRHMNAVHVKGRPHKCNICDKAFKEATHLRYHLKTHDNPNSKKRGLNKDSVDTTKGSKRSLSSKSTNRIAHIVGNQDIFRFTQNQGRNNSQVQKPQTRIQDQPRSQSPQEPTVHNNTTKSVPITAENELQNLTNTETEQTEILTEKDGWSGNVNGINQNWLLNL